MPVQTKTSHFEQHLSQAQDWSQLARSIEDIDVAFRAGELSAAQAESLAQISIQLSRSLVVSQGGLNQGADRLAA
jgi:hypothetical protein